MKPLPDDCSSLRRALREDVVRWQTIRAAPGAWLLNEFVVRNGLDCHAQKLPARRFTRGTPNNCFYNTAQLVEGRDDLRHVEGVAWQHGTGLPLFLHHAWAIDRKDRVIDVTLDDPTQWQFCGIVMTPEQYEQYVGLSGTYSAFSNVIDMIVPEAILTHDPEITEAMLPEHRELVQRLVA